MIKQSPQASFNGFTGFFFEIVICLAFYFVVVVPSDFAINEFNIIVQAIPTVEESELYVRSFEIPKPMEKAILAMESSIREMEKFKNVIPEKTDRYPASSLATDLMVIIVNFLHAFITHPMTISILFLFIVLNTASSLLLSSTFGNALMGASTQGGLLVTRPKAMVRFFLGLLMAPFIIFELPALFGWPTLKEIVTFSRLQYKYKTMKAFGFIMLPLIPIGLLFYPVIKHFDMLAKSSYQVENIPTQASAPQNSAQTTWAVHRIKMQANPEPYQRFLPYFEYKNNRVYPSIMYMDLQEKSSLSYGTQEIINLKELGIEKIVKNDPFFAKRFPMLAKYYKEEQDKSPDKQGDYLKEYTEELSSLYGHILSLNLKNVPSFITSVSPIAGLYIGLKKSLLAKISEYPSGEWFKFNIGDMPFFEYKNTSQNTYKIFHPHTTPGTVLVWTAQFEKESVRFYETFLTEFIKQSSPLAAKTGPVPSGKNLTTFGLVDYLSPFGQQKYNKKGHRDVVNFFKRKIEAANNDQYYLDKLKESLLSFKQS